MLFTFDIKNSAVTKFFTLTLLVSLIIQSFLISDMINTKVLCIGSDGHVAIENTDTCPVTYNKHDKPATILHKSLENSSHTDNIHCADIILSSDEVTGKQIQKSIKDISRLSISFISLTLKNLFNSNIIHIPFYISNYKILSANSTVKLLL